MSGGRSGKVEQFRGAYFFLSNFSPAWVDLDGEEYRTVEHAYQAAKTMDLSERLTIRRVVTPGGAKRLGREVSLRPDWEAMRILVMRGLLRQKFAPRTEYAVHLLATGDRELVEGNWWGDTFWGVSLQDGKGANMLGKLLMEIRFQLQDTQEVANWWNRKP